MKRIVLAGGGHAHVHVLQAFAREPVPGAEITLVSPQARLVYSGMVPGWVGARYTMAECSIALQPLCEAARVRWRAGTVARVEADRRRVVLSDGQSLDYDVLSLNTGSCPQGRGIVGASEHALPLRPLESFVAKWGELQADIDYVTSAQGGSRKLAIVVVGAGAGGVELALALHHRLGAGARVVLVTGGTDVLPAHPPAARSLIVTSLRRCRIPIVRMSCVAVADREAVLQSESGSQVTVACDVAVLATGSEPPSWLAASGLSLDADGFVATAPTLQTLSHPEVFAAGDIASRPDAPHPRSGVYAVRAGPPLAFNLRRYAAGGELQRHRPRRWSLNLLGCGDGSAIATWGPFATHGRWVWWWKDRIDRRFVEAFRTPSPTASATTSASAR